ncbi:MAG: hypothetical protein HC889_16105 [Synechococcaceae cyanobacterium SM1_2_3]|nr:hypothetical protein [Synechococcaceae cyanobacterium SM1_2_3]
MGLADRHSTYNHIKGMWLKAGLRMWGGPRLNSAQARRVKVAMLRFAAGQYGPAERDALTRWADRAARAADPADVIRPVWRREGVTRLVHDISHEIMGMITGSKRHCPAHAMLERFLTERAIAMGAHKLNAPAPKAKPKVDVVAKRASAAAANLANWERKLTRAQKAVKKWGAKVRYYEGKTATLAEN